MTNYLQTIITLYDGASYDSLNIDKKYKDTIYVKSLRLSDIGTLNTALFTDKSLTDADSLKELKDVVQKTTFENTTVNFECCSGCTTSCNGHRTFGFGIKDSEHKTAWEFIVNCMNVGVKLVFADFSLKSLINLWNKYADVSVFGQCPVKHINDTEGHIKVVGHEDKLNDCPLFQLKNAGDLSRKSNGYYTLGVHTLSQNIVYQLTNVDEDFEIIEKMDENDEIQQPKNTIDVLSYWYHDKPEFAGKSFEDIPKTEVLPCHAMINVSGMNGMILISQCHLSELTKIDPDYKTVVRHYAKSKGISYEQAAMMPAPVIAQYTQTEVTTAPPVIIPQKMQTC